MSPKIHSERTYGSVDALVNVTSSRAKIFDEASKFGDVYVKFGSPIPRLIFVVIQHPSSLTILKSADSIAFTIAIDGADNKS